MNRIRVIPILLLKNKGLVKTVKFKNPTYIGDPINAVKILNEKEVDELVFLDIEASKKNKPPDYHMIEDIASECFMPLAYGGGINSLEQIKRIFGIGVEKVVINSAVVTNSKLITEAANIFGNQSIVVSIDVKNNIFGKYIAYTKSASHKINRNIVDFAKHVEELGVGEIILSSIDREGTFGHYDLKLLKSISQNVNIPVVANGGASDIADFTMAVNEGGASAVAAGSLFVYKSKNKGILINYPSQADLKEKLFNKVALS